jgi:WD40 repeat protein
VAVTDCALEAVALSRDGRRTAVADSEGNVIVLDAAGKVLEVRPQVDSDPVSALALSADGSQLLVATRGGKLRRYTSGVETPEKIGGVVAPLTALDFSPDDAFLVSGSGGGSVQLWDMRPPGLPRPMSAPEPAHAGGVPTVAFSSDGRSFFSMGLRGDRRTWPAPGTWADRMCEKLVSNLSRKAWAEWVSADDLPYRCACPELPIAPDDPSTPLASGERCPAGG